MLELKSFLRELRWVNFTAIDFETANPSADSACSVGLVQVCDGAIIRSEVRLIRPPSGWFTFSDIHGLHWSDVAEAPTFGEVWPTLAPLLEGSVYFAAHNAGFDRRVLYACCERYGLRPPEQPFVCTLVMARRMWNLRPANLSAVCRHLGIPLNHHEALSDATACAKIVLAASAQTRMMSQGPQTSMTLT